MNTPSPDLTNHYGFRIPAAADAWAARMEAACRVLESRFGTQLNTAAGGTKFRTTWNAVKNRDTFFRDHLKTKGRGFGLSNGTRGDQAVRLGGSMSHETDVFSVNVRHPDRGIQILEELFAELGDALEAQSSQFTPHAALQRIVNAQWYTIRGNSASRFDPGEVLPEEAQLPPLSAHSHVQGAHPLTPQHLGWINYWSEEVCEHVGFPAALDGHPVLQDCYRTPRGAWVVKLGREPFEPRNVAHLRLLREMYDRLPRVGIRIPEGTPLHDIPRPNLPNAYGPGASYSRS